MRTFLTSILLLLIIGNQGCLIAKKIGHYAGEGYSLRLSSDSTFTYRYYGHIGGDTSAGKYRVNRDTILMSYHLNNYDSIMRAAAEKKETPPIDIMLSSRHWTLRPQKMIWKNSRLFFVNPETHQRNKNFYLKLMN